VVGVSGGGGWGSGGGGGVGEWGWGASRNPQSPTLIINKFKV